MSALRGRNKVVSFTGSPFLSGCGRADKTDEYHFFITRSDVIRDRLERDKPHMPFIAKIKKIKITRLTNNQQRGP